MHLQLGREYANVVNLGLLTTYISSLLLPYIFLASWNSVPGYRWPRRIRQKWQLSLLECFYGAIACGAVGLLLHSFLNGSGIELISALVILGALIVLEIKEYEIASEWFE